MERTGLRVAARRCTVCNRDLTGEGSGSLAPTMHPPLLEASERDTVRVRGAVTVAC
jgi:hypothetical protein